MTVHLWSERIGDPGHPAVLLVAGASAQGYTWPDALVQRLVEQGRQVIRYDHRDTGLSTVVDFEKHPYGLADLARDAVAVLDSYGLASAHIAGASMGGMIGQWLAVHEPARVRSLTLLSTTPMDYDPSPLWRYAGARGPHDLPGPAAHFLQHLTDSDGAAPGVESDLALFRVMNGGVLPFDEPTAREALERCWARTTDAAAAGNHQRACVRMSPDRLVPLATITAPTVVVHGDRDPIYAPSHGAFLATTVPGARLEVVPGMGHVYFSPGLPERLAGLIAQNSI
ncbi:alpha/beta fold hydrolase [Actinoplanes sp. NPDC023714]|uniref:alpha/beta fold hydrolase n=1 Tax=Actinoplanes sp. NPDC023714 TaxID=3154322 RepID=UPI0033FEA839